MEQLPKTEHEQAPKIESREEIKKKLIEGMEALDDDLDKVAPYAGPMLSNVQSFIDQNIRRKLNGIKELIEQL